jgi:uncharacterized membrane protein YhhN
MAKLALAARDWRDKIRVWFEPPGWVPANMRPAGPRTSFDPSTVPIHNPPAGRAASILVLAALAAMIGATAAFLLAGPHLPLANGFAVLLTFAAVLGGMGALLDGKISILETLYVFCAALTSAAYALDWPDVEAAAKPAALALLILAFSARKGRRDVKRLVMAALIACLAGDTLLLWPSLFVPGLIAFLVAHGFFIPAFSRGVGFWPSRSAVAAIGAFAVAVLAYVWPGVGAGMRAPVAIYVAVISLMAAQAAGRATVLRDRASVAVALGAILFMLSDMTIALFKFGNLGCPVDQWTLPTYYLAQGLIAFFVLPRARRDDGAQA